MTDAKDATVPEEAQPEILELDATAEMPDEFVAPGGAQPAQAEDEEASFMSASDQKLAEANERYVRLMADFDNFRKRAAKERLDAQAYAVEEAIREIIPVMDNLERALGASQAGSAAEGSASVVKGVELTLRMFQVVLGKFGVERMAVVGKPFDPNLHEALMQMESDEVQVETVSEELEPGYVMKGRVVRPARVKVLKPKPSDGVV